MEELASIIVGIFALSGGSRMVVNNATLIAQRFDVSDLFIGLTILAFGTDLPELLISVRGAINNLQGTESSGVIVGNAIGSSVTQISLVLGITAWIRYLNVGKRQTFTLTIELLGSCLLLFLVGLDGTISRVDGIILLTAFIIYLVASFRTSRGGVSSKPETKPKPVWQALLLLAVGLIIVISGAEVTVQSAITLSKTWGIKQSFVGAVIIGLGTSLPEVAISLQSIAQKNMQLSIGNIIGSNIFDLLVPIGTGATISTLQFGSDNLWFDLPFLFVITAIILWFLSRKRGLQHWEGIVMVVMYLIYVAVKFFFPATIP